MEYHHIANTQLRVSSLCLGTWVLSGDAWGKVDKQEAISAIHAALDHGINFIDTAPVYGYGNAENIIGQAINGRDRGKIILASKCGLIGRGRAMTHNLTPKSIRSELIGTLERLGTDYIDLYQCHWPDPKTPIEDTMNELKRLQDEGKIKNIGVSNFDLTLLQKTSAITEIATFQGQFSLLERNLEKELLPFCRKQGMGVLAYGPLAGGILSGKYNAPPQFKGGDARAFFYKFYTGAAFEKTRKFLHGLKELNQPLNQIAINWVRQQPGVSSVIVGCRNKDQVMQNIAAISWKLNEAELSQIHKLLGSLFQ